MIAMIAKCIMLRRTSAPDVEPKLSKAAAKRPRGVIELPSHLRPPFEDEEGLW